MPKIRNMKRRFDTFDGLWFKRGVLRPRGGKCRSAGSDLRQTYFPMKRRGFDQAVQTFIPGPALPHGYRTARARFRIASAKRMAAATER